MKSIISISIKIILSVIVLFASTLIYTIIIEFTGHGLLPSLIAPLGLLVLIPLWKKDAQTINGDTVNTVIKSISMTEKFVFVLLLLFISSVLKATGMSMSFSTTLIFLSIIFFIYKRITTKTISGEKVTTTTIESKKETHKFIFSERKKITIMIFTVLLLIIALFYWFEIRPSKIRQECSFVTKHIDAIPARPAKTKSELLSEGIIKPCSIFDQLYYGQFSNETEDKQFCENRNRVLIESYSKPILAEEAKDILEPATKEEYDFCIRSNGLKN